MDNDGEERFEISGAYYRKANVVILCCSLDDDESLSYIRDFHEDAQNYIYGQDTIYAIMATKADLPEEARQVTKQSLENMANRLNILLHLVFQVSAKTGEGVDDLLRDLCNAFVAANSGKGSSN